MRNKKVFSMGSKPTEGKQVDLAELMVVLVRVAIFADVTRYPVIMVDVSAINLKQPDTT